MKNKNLKLFVLFALMLTLVVGCGKKEEKETVDPIDDGPSESEKKEYKRNCEIAAQKAYNSYKIRSSKPIKEGLCSSSSSNFVYIYFKIEDELLYQFQYIVDEDRISYNETLGNTENHEQCKGQSKDDLSIVCANQNLLLANYETTLDLTDSIYSYQYMKVDLSKLN